LFYLNIFGGEMNSAKSGRFLYALAALALVGVALSFYATWHYYGVQQGENFACNINDWLSCDNVATSPYAVFLGVPVAVWGIGYFVGFVFLLGPILVQASSAKDCMLFIPVYTAVGLVVSMVLFFVSVFMISGVCPTCFGVYLVCIAIAIVVWTLRQQWWEFRDKPSALVNGGSFAAFGVILVVFANSLLGGWRGPQDPNLINELPPQLTGITTQEIKIHRSRYSGFGEDFRKGSDQAPVQIVEFADFQCGACGVAAKAIHEVYEFFPSQVQVVFKNYPLDRACNSDIRRDMHPFSCEAATLARCLGERGDFWSFHDQVFANQHQINSANLKAWAKDLGLSQTEAERCLTSNDFKQKVMDDIKEARELFVNATPTIFINGQRYSGALNSAAIIRQVQLLLDAKP
jgi:protein-disulfide isomerase/uncharacterized membrane protein